MPGIGKAQEGDDSEEKPSRPVLVRADIQRKDVYGNPASHMKVFHVRFVYVRTVLSKFCENVGKIFFCKRILPIVFLG